MSTVTFIALAVVCYGLLWVFLGALMFVSGREEMSLEDELQEIIDRSELNRRVR